MQKLVIFVAIFTLVLALVPTQAFALGSVLNRKITLSNALGAATPVSYTFTSDALPTTGTAIKSVDIQFCTSISGGTCSGTPSGFSASSSTLASQPTGLGAGSGWTVDATSQYDLRVVNASNSTNPSGSVSIQWNSVHNPTANNSTFYAQITTYTGSDWSTGPTDRGNLSLSTSQSITVNLGVSETLTFCTGTSITNQDCSSVAGTTVNLGDGDVSSTKSGTSVLSGSTNALHGYTVTVNGTTLTDALSDTITASSNATSSVGTEQFGLNLKDNATPNVGTEVTGTGSATAQGNYANVDHYTFATGNTVASTTVPTNGNTFTVSYIANIAGTTEPGAYTTALDYIATANF